MPENDGGLWHRDVMAQEIPPAHDLVEGVVEKGTVGAIVGLPKIGKTWLALELAMKVAGGGEMLGGRQVKPGVVAYLWQDDSTRSERKRVQEFSRRAGLADDLPIRWYFNERFELPHHVDILRAMAERHGLVLIVCDSLYNFLPGLKLKDEEPGAIVAQLKTEVCDATGCTVAIIDHAPWPSEGNRGQKRAYGGVFKTAACRWTIFLEEERGGEGGTWVQATGNNIEGIPRTLFRRDPATMQLWRPEPMQDVDKEVRRGKLLAYITQHPGQAQSEIEDGFGGQRQEVREDLDWLASSGRAEIAPRELAQRLGRKANAKLYYAHGHKDLCSPGEQRANGGEQPAQVTERACSPNSPAPLRGASCGASSDRDPARTQ